MIRETTVSDFRSNTRAFLDAVESGDTVRIYRSGRPVADVVPVPSRTPAWKNPPGHRLSLAGIDLSGEVLADRQRSP